MQNATTGDFKNDCLKAHNKYRGIHGVPPLVLDEGISKVSQEWANKIATKGKMEHSTNKSYGENIYNFFSTDKNAKIDGNAPADLWYSEIKDYKFGKEERPAKTGHFTQLVWKSSERLGIGAAKNKKGTIFVVANYAPPGNFVGKYVENVLPPKN